MINTHPTRCNICGGSVTYGSNARVYGREYGSGYCYLCQTCGAYVGTHKPRPREALDIAVKRFIQGIKEEKKSINFPWYLNIWVNIIKNEERIFWRTMTPARCAALYGEYFRLVTPQTERAEKEECSLSQYLMGGGG